MTLRIHATPEAEADIIEAYVWYEDMRAGLGDAFVQALRETLTLVAKRPAAFRMVDERLRRALVGQFPYSTVFLHDDRTVVVIRCLHARRDPTAWRIRGRLYSDG